ncbi:unnamed protein product [Clonostachys rosea]|uniref:Pentatricopeptide repeat-containing protein-mitochondrial domain-containing protein n=1 Tax=Bionectria ochroleuca TaxID=29856 RepID=A0ABY6UJ47_BIOOC|nr:unnamed protein product [Clonostachys rosea]
MKISARVDGSVCGAVFSSRSSSSLRGVLASGRRQLCSSRDKPKSAQKGSNKTEHGSSFFCSRTSQWLGSTFFSNFEPRPASSIARKRDVRQAYSTAAAAVSSDSRRSVPHMSLQDRQKLRSYVDGEPESTVNEHLDFYRDTYRSGYAIPDAPSIKISNAKLDVDYPSQDQIYTPSDELKTLNSRLCGAIGFRIRHPHRISLSTIFDHYMKLPEPRMLNFSARWRDKLLLVMARPPKRDVGDMLRYFGLMSDVTKAGLTIRPSQWNFALSLATKHAGNGVDQVDSAMRLWKRMERELGENTNEVTFNILFDAASKVGNFTLAELIFGEMEKRGIQFNRFHHVSLIYYFGLRLDSDGIRAAYKEMVESGEVIDTVALNCVISGFLRCGEVQAAEQTYRRMVDNSPAIKKLPEKDYRVEKVLTQAFLMFAKLGKDHPELVKSSQTNMWLSPDIRTYRLMVEHFAISVGDLQKVARYLDEMEHLQIPVHPTIFLALFKGFYVHGGSGRDTAWTVQRLNGVLSALYNARDCRVRGFRIDSWLVIWALRAVRKCSTDDRDVQNAFDNMKRRWDIAPQRREFLHDLLTNILDGSDLKSKHKTRDTLHQVYQNKAIGI